MSERLDPLRALARFFGVYARGRSYLNALYLLLAMPLGIVYFCFLAIGLSLGVGLLIVWVGLIVLATVLLGTWTLAAFERQQAIWLLGAEVPTSAPAPPGSPLLERAKRLLSDRLTWTGPLFLLLKFPLGIASFVLFVAGTAFSLALLSAPFTYPFADLGFSFGSWGSWWIDTLPEALLCSGIGFLLLTATLHAFNGLAWLWKRLSMALLGRGGAPAAPTADSAMAAV